MRIRIRERESAMKMGRTCNTSEMEKKVEAAAGED